MEGGRNWTHVIAQDHPGARDYLGASRGCPFLVPLTTRVPVLGAIGREGWNKKKKYGAIYDAQDRVGAILRCPILALVLGQVSSTNGNLSTYDIICALGMKK